MKDRKFFLIKAILFSALALGIAFYTIPLIHESEFFMLKVIFFYLIILAVALFWAIAIFYKVLNKMTSDTMLKYDNMERILLDLRDGTKYFYREKRLSLRIKTDMIARFTGKNISHEFVKIVDIGCGGALLKTTQPMHEGEMVGLDIHLPFFSQPIHAEAVVKRVRSTKEFRGTSLVLEAGVEYAEISRPDREKLAETIDILSRIPRKK